MKISDPIMKTFTFGELKEMARKNLEKIIKSSTNKTDLLFKTAGFYGDLVKVIQEHAKKDCYYPDCNVCEKIKECPMKGRMCQCSAKEKCIHND